MVELQEKNFIREGYGENSYPFKFWAILVAFAIILIYGASYKANNLVSEQQLSSPFLRVTNRQFSLFLWQHPQFMRVHAKNKIGYLPGFQYLHKVNMELEFSEEYVVVPPGTLYLYHTWNRLNSSYLPSRPILYHEFKEFLNALSEWQPKNWILAPKEYVDLSNGLNELKNQNMETLSLNQLPFEIRQAFFGWKNYFKEGDAINAFNPDYLQMEEFLKIHPNYARNYWQNILLESHPNYLKSFTEGNYDKHATIPKDEIAPFLRVAIYNHTKALQERGHSS